jgi:phenylacetic acid degradation operon negative regulatory protein
VLGEFVLPAGGSVWTSSMVAAADVLGISERNARQAISRIAGQRLIESGRHGRLVRWSLTERGRRLLEAGAHRIYEFGTASRDWDGEWLVVHCPVPEAQRTVRHRLRSALAFQGFGELSPSLTISPHVAREDELRRTLDELGLLGDSVVLHSRTGSPTEDSELVARAWSLAELASTYDGFCRAHTRVRPEDPAGMFRATVELVHDWRRFPFVDPELPAELLPQDWAGASAADLFRDRRAAWLPAARAWFDEHDDIPQRPAS